MGFGEEIADSRISKSSILTKIGKSHNLYLSYSFLANANHLRCLSPFALHSKINIEEASAECDLKETAIIEALFWTPKLNCIFIRKLYSMPETKISLIVGLKNNLDYSKMFYDSVRSLYKNVEIVFVSFGSSDGTHEWLKNLSDENVKYFYSEESKTLSDTYNKGVQLATKPFVAYLHNDMILAPRFFEELQVVLDPESVLFYTAIEPPIFSKDLHDWKVIADFGDSISNFDQGSFYRFAESRLSDNHLTRRKTNDPAFFLCASRDMLLEIGGLDPLFDPMFCEDSDLLIRFRLKNLNFIHVPKAMVYHFVSKTSRFSEEYIAKTREIEARSSRNFFRKWGFEAHMPLNVRYRHVALIQNLPVTAIVRFEPYFDCIYTSTDSASYIAEEQKLTLFDLSKRLKPIKDLSQEVNAILVKFDYAALNDSDFLRIKRISEIVWKRNLRNQKWWRRLISRKDFVRGNIKFSSKNLDSYADKLIIRDKRNISY